MPKVRGSATLLGGRQRRQRATTSCLPFTTFVMKLSRSRSPLLSKLTSIRMPGYSFTVSLTPCIALANAFGSTLPTFSVTALTMYIAGVALEPVVVGLVVVFLLELAGERLDAGAGASAVRPTCATAPFAASPPSSITFWLVSTVSPTIGLS
jgi:hypothetical protein